MQVTIAAHDLQRDRFVTLVEAMREAAATKRYATWSRLRRHLEQTLGSVAMLAAGVLGVTTSDAERDVMLLACGIGLTRILPQIRRDLARGRILLPLEDLAQARYSERDLAAHVVNDALMRLMRSEIDRARSFFHEGAGVIAHLSSEGARLAA